MRACLAHTFTDELHRGQGDGKREQLGGVNSPCGPRQLWESRSQAGSPEELSWLERRVSLGTVAGGGVEPAARVSWQRPPKPA